MCPFLKLKTCTFFLSFHVILKFSFDFPLYLPITLVILDDLDIYAALSAWWDARLLPEGGTQLTSTLHFLHSLERAEERR